MEGGNKASHQSRPALGLRLAEPTVDRDPGPRRSPPQLLAAPPDLEPALDQGVRQAPGRVEGTRAKGQLRGEAAPSPRSS
eukprot:9020785-Pyramimonas_sp.AAC.1